MRLRTRYWSPHGHMNLLDVGSHEDGLPEGTPNPPYERTGL